MKPRRFDKVLHLRALRLIRLRNQHRDTDQKLPVLRYKEALSLVSKASQMAPYKPY